MNGMQCAQTCGRVEHREDNNKNTLQSLAETVVATAICEYLFKSSTEQKRVGGSDGTVGFA